MWRPRANNISLFFQKHRSKKKEENIFSLANIFFIFLSLSSLYATEIQCSMLFNSFHPGYLLPYILSISELYSRNFVALWDYGLNYTLIALIFQYESKWIDLQRQTDRHRERKYEKWLLDISCGNWDKERTTQNRHNN